MRIARWSIVLLCCLLLTGCASILDREYRVVELHSSKFWESDADDILRAESYQDIVNDLLLLVGEYQQQATLRLYSDDSEGEVASTLERAAAEVQKSTPLGAYAVGYIITESTQQHDYYEVTVRISYRRTRDQMKAIVNATSVTALEHLLSAAMDSGRKELVVRLGYWNEGDEEIVSNTMLAVEEYWELTGTQVWTARYYPSAADAGLIEFHLEPAPPKPTVPQETEKPAEPQQPAENEPPVTGEVPTESGTPTEGQPSAEPEAPSAGEVPAGTTEGQLPAEPEAPTAGEAPDEGTLPAPEEQTGESVPSDGEGASIPAEEAAPLPANTPSTAV